MSNVIEFKKPDFMDYIEDEYGLTGVKCKGLSISMSGTFAHIQTWEKSMSTILSMDEMNQMCIAWLALHKPDLVNSLNPSFNSLPVLPNGIVSFLNVLYLSLSADLSSLTSENELEETVSINITVTNNFFTSNLRLRIVILKQDCCQIAAKC